MDIDLTDEERIKILNSDDLYTIMQKILLRENKIDQNREHFWVIGLENNQRVLFIELISLGSVNQTLVEPMEVFSLALQKRAVKIILCHNHPNGELRPSPEDLDLTDRLIQVGLIVDTPVLDHLIISEKSFLSLEDNGYMKELRKSSKHVPTYMVIENAKREAAKIAKRHKAIEIAKKLKRIGTDNAVIAEVTGISIVEIEALRVRLKK